MEWCFFNRCQSRKERLLKAKKVVYGVISASGVEVAVAISKTKALLISLVIRATLDCGMEIFCLTDGHGVEDGVFRA